MTAIVDVENPAIIATALTGIFCVPSNQLPEQATLEIIAPDFDFSFSSPLIEITPIIDSNTVILKASLDLHVQMVLTLIGRFIEGGKQFKVEAVLLQMELEKEVVRANFVASSLYALLALATEVRLFIPEHEIDLKLKFDVTLLESSRFLQIRQRAYRLMVIERATGIEFSFPLHFSEDQILTIIFVYRAIVDRSFNFPLETYPHTFLANQDSLDLITTMKQPSSISFIEENARESILGRDVLLGNKRMTVEDAIIENYNKVKQKLAYLDNHEVVAIIRSLSGQIRFELPEAPHLPGKSWNLNVQTLVDLESQLDAGLCEGYNALAAATLADLTEEEKAEVTARTESNEEVFLIDGMDGEP